MCTHSQGHTHALACTHMLRHTCTYTCTHMRAFTQTCRHVYTQTQNIRMHTHTHMEKNTHVHTRTFFPFQISGVTVSIHQQTLEFLGHPPCPLIQPWVSIPPCCSPLPLPHSAGPVAPQDLPQVEDREAASTPSLPVRRQHLPFLPSNQPHPSIHTGPPGSGLLQTSK